jgi:hypothetical protein
VGQGEDVSENLCFCQQFNENIVLGFFFKKILLLFFFVADFRDEEEK